MSAVQEIEDLWSRLEAWAGDNAPDMLSDLNVGASADEVRVLEAALGLALPDAFKASLAVHNGEDDGWPCKVFADHGAYLSAVRIVEEWRQRQEFALPLEGDADELIRDDVISVDGPVRPEMFRREWVPFMDCNGDVFWALDFAPDDGGTPGQVIEVDWEACSWRVVSASFADFFSAYVESIARGS